MEDGVIVVGEIVRRSDSFDPARLSPRSADAGDPFAAVLDVILDPRSPATRWAIVRGSEADAHAALGLARRERVRLIVLCGQPDADALLADLTPVLGTLVGEMTSAQRRIARGILLDGLRQSEIAARLDISRPSVSVAHARGHIREAGLLLRAVRATWSAGLASMAQAVDDRW